MKETADSILKFWFYELTPDDWFRKSDELDNMIGQRFGQYLEMASKGELFQWRKSPKGRLAEIIILDQFSRNIHRGTSKAFQNDMMALTLAQEMVLLKQDDSLSDVERKFAYMPYMHSESPLIHQEALRLFEKLNDKETLEYEILHKEIIDRFGRYPHRNMILGRDSTPEEIEFLRHNPGF